MEKTKKFREKHSLEVTKHSGKNELKRKSRKNTLPIIDGGDQEENLKLPQRVFLYLQPKTISFPSDDAPSERVEIEMGHEKNTITTLSNHFTPRNIIRVDQLNTEKPTFSITIEQDSIEDMTDLSDAPIVLTLYVFKLRISRVSEIIVEIPNSKKDEVKERDVYLEDRIPVAQGFIDIMEYFKKKRSQSSHTIYLYPLETSANALTCKTEWEIYSLHPLLKNITYSNVIFITLGSLYNINDYLMNDCNDLVANLSFLSKIPNKNNEYKKIFICKFSGFSKSIISEQNLSKKWENLKNTELNNSQSIGIASDSKYCLDKLFSNMLTTENVEFHMERINITEDYALICNSMHRYILTDNMEKILEDTLTNDPYEINNRNLFGTRSKYNFITRINGFIDIFISRRNCSYAVELKPPEFNKPNSLPTSKATPKIGKNKKKDKISKDSGEPSTIEEKIPFASIEICLNKPITNSSQDITELSMNEFKSNPYEQSSMPHDASKSPKKTLNMLYAKNYKLFENLVREILDHIVRNNIKTIDDDKEFFCSQLGNITNRIMKLMACDFSIRNPTKTNIEFKNLMTNVYHELIDKIYEIIKKCRTNGIENSVTSLTKGQNTIIPHMSLVKYMYEVGNMEWAEFFMKNLRNDYQNNQMLYFYIYLYNIERQHFQLAKEYLEIHLADQDADNQYIIDLINIYLNYKLELQNPEQTENADENLIKVLTEYCSYSYPKSLFGWILLHCLYKKHNYPPGISYSRWKYENLYNEIFVKLENIPKSRWEIYMPHKIALKTVKGQNFGKILEQLLRMGLYDFAEWVFEEISNECMELEKYFIYNTLKIVNNKLDNKFIIKDFDVEKLLNPMHLRATLSQLNGNLEYYRHTSRPASMIHYNAIIINELDTYHHYQLGILRFAYHNMNEKQYEKAATTFLYCCSEEVEVNCIAAMERGKACYKLGQLEEAEKYFAISTKYDTYIPNTWAYLALINLKLGQNYKALECWKYARLNPENVIDVEIMNELSKINASDIFLYVDVPN